MSAETRLLRFETLRIPSLTVRKRARVAVDGALTLGVLLSFGALGVLIKGRFDLVLPGTVIGLIALAAALFALESALPRVFVRMHETIAPTSRLLLKHLGLLFVPAGVGIISEGPALRQSGLALGAAVLCSTLVGVTVTCVAMRLLVRTGHTSSTGAPTAC